MGVGLGTMVGVGSAFGGMDDGAINAAMLTEQLVQRGQQPRDEMTVFIGNIVCA